MRFNYKIFLRRTLALNVTSNARWFFSKGKHTPTFRFPTSSSLNYTKTNRYLSDKCSTSSSPTLADSREFTVVLENIISDLKEAGRNVDPSVSDWYDKLLRYTIPGGKKNRGLSLITSYRILAHQASQSDENMRLAYTMACCIEMWHLFFLFVDDLLDGAHVRRGRPCWHCLDGNKKMANNDAVLLENGVYIILRKYFHNKPYYLKVLELFHEMTAEVAMGQCLDVIMLKNFQSTKKLDEFTMSRYRNLVINKTADYSFYVPIGLAMYMSGTTDVELHRQAKDAMVEMGIMLQIQDDYLNCFGDLNLLGKEGTDIAFGRCTWLIVVATQRANARQKAILEECYGQADADKIEAVTNIYEEIGLPKIFAAYEEETYNQLVHRIKTLPEQLPREAIFDILDKIYKRKL